MTETHLQGFIRLAVAVIGISAVLGSAPAQAGTRPFGDFLQAQGTYCADIDGLPGCDLFHSPDPNIIHFTGPPPAYNFVAVVDYAGLYNNLLIAGGKPSLGTKITGQVNERRLSNGQAEVQIALQIKDALTFVLEPSGPDHLAFPAIYGRKFDQVLAGTEATLSDCSMQVNLINTSPGAPLPDLFQAAFFSSNDQFIKAVGISCSGKGPLASGETATFVMRQTGTFLRTPFGGANGDGAPVEVIAIHPVSGNSAFEFRKAPGQ